VLAETQHCTGMLYTLCFALEHVFLREEEGESVCLRAWWNTSVIPATQET
jgi:hypothetical protein